MPEDVTIRSATPADHLAVMRILDGAMLAIEAETVQDRIDTDDVLVAVRQSTNHLLGAIVVDTADGSTCRIEAIAVRSTDRDRGIGTALIEAISDRETALIAEFDADDRPFYRSMGFDIDSTDEVGRFRGRYDPGADRD